MEWSTNPIHQVNRWRLIADGEEVFGGKNKNNEKVYNRYDKLFSYQKMPWKIVKELPNLAGKDILA